MTDEVTRRTLLLLGASAPLALLAACAAEEPPAAAPIADPTPTLTRSPSPRPTLVRSFGPNGTHYPEHLPWIGEPAATELEVDCTWVAIGRVLDSITAAQANAGVVIRVRPGVLVGGGAGSRQTPVLTGKGDPTWERGVIIVPRDGFGTVFVMQRGFRIDRCSNIAFFGIDGRDVEFYATNCVKVTLGWSHWAAVNFTQSGSELEMYELVLGFRRTIHDTFAVRPTETNEMLAIRRFGCVFGPSVKPLDDPAHSDTIQLERTGIGAFGPFTSVDCIDLGSTNSVILAHDSVSLVEFDHCMVLGLELPWRLFPLTDADTHGSPNAFSGLAQDVRLHDSIVCGPIGRLRFTTVTNTTLSYVPVFEQQPKVAGAWTVDASLPNWTAPDIEGVAGQILTREALGRHWVW